MNSVQERLTRFWEPAGRPEGLFLGGATSATDEAELYRRTADTLPETTVIAAGIVPHSTPASIGRSRSTKRSGTPDGSSIEPPTFPMYLVE